MMRQCLAVMAIAGVAGAASLALDLRDDATIATIGYKQWAAMFKTTTTAAGEGAFEANRKFILDHNARAGKGLETYRTGLNQFADLTSEQFAAKWLRPMNRSGHIRNEKRLSLTPAAAVDWRTKHAVTPVKNQGQCGSCWSFSTTGSTEGAVAIAGGALIPLSEQQLMDCSTAEGDHSCEGGLMDYAFKYIIQNGGIDSEVDYPYKMRDEVCDHTKEQKKVAKITGFHDVPQNEEAQLIAAINVGPVSVAIEADQAGFQHYASGTFSGPCGTKLDHGVLAVGYTDTAIIVKNSWGATWGNEGYIEMARGITPPNGICGIAMQPSYPVAGKNPPGPPSPPGPPPPHPPAPSKACSAVSPANRTDCGFTATEEECKEKKCCYDVSVPFTYKCFHPDVCAAINPGDRLDCGFGIGKEACLEKGCCFDATVPGTYECFKKTPAPPPVVEV